MDVEWLRGIEGDLVGADRIVDVSALSGGEVNETLKVRCASGMTLVVRRAPVEVADWHPSIDGQVAAIDRARDVGVPGPEVVYANGRVLAYKHIGGTALDRSAVPPDLAKAAGRLHGTLHSVRGDGVGPVQADGTSAGWPADVAFADVTKWVDHLLKTASPLEDADIRAAASMLGGLTDSRSRLLHGDASPGNTIVSEGRIAAVIDFDDAWYGEPAGDAAWWWWNSPETGDDFVAGCAESNETTEPRMIWLYRLRLLLGLADAFATTNPDRAKRIASLLHYAVEEASTVVK